VFIATLNSVAVISGREVLLVEKIGLKSENHRPVVSHKQTIPHKVASSTPRYKSLTNLSNKFASARHWRESSLQA
jgi:hypothetical protein